MHVLNNKLPTKAAQLALLIFNGYQTVLEKCIEGLLHNNIEVFSRSD